jgi:predicted nucleic acid-binding protein
VPAFVLDASLALAWVLPDEKRAATDALLWQAAERGAVVPAIWHVEIAHTLNAAVRAERISADDRARCLADLADLPVRVDAETSARAWREILDVADGTQLAVYDATYVEAAQRLRLPLATLDRQMRRAAAALGVALVA